MQLEDDTNAHASAPEQSVVGQHVTGETGHAAMEGGLADGQLSEAFIVQAF